MATCTFCGKIVGSGALKCKYCFEDLLPSLDEEFFLMTSGNSFEGYDIIDQYGFVYGEIVCPNGIFGAITNGTFFTFQAMADARSKAIDALKAYAKGVGANAVIGMDIDVTDLNGKGVLVSANATGVYIIPTDYENKLKIMTHKAALKQQKLDREKFLKREQAEKEKQEKEARELKQKEDFEEYIKNLAGEEYEYSQLELGILKVICDNDNSSAAFIVRTLPKNIATQEEIMKAIKNLENSEIIYANVYGYYNISAISEEFEKIKKEKVDKAKMQEEQERTQSLAQEEADAKKQSEEEYINSLMDGCSSIEQNIIRTISKNEHMNAMEIARMFPKNIAPNEIMTAIRHLEEVGKISSADNGVYHIVTGN